MACVKKLLPHLKTTSNCLALMAAFATAATANPDTVNDPVVPPEEAKTESKIGLKNGSVIVVPVPFANPAIGSGLVLGGAYLFQLDSDVDLSYVGLGVMRSDNGSNAYGGAASLSFANGWSFDFAVAEAEARYDLFFNSFKIPIQQDGLLVNAGVDYNVSETTSVGVALRYLDTNVTLDAGGTVIPPGLIPDVSLEIMSIGARLEWDTRDDDSYPTTGSHLNVSANYGFTLSGASRDYAYSKANFEIYRSLSETSVFAARLSTCATTSDTPFFDQCSIGASDSFRGFSPAQYYDYRLVSSQVEFRQRLGKRFGVVAFGGVGWTGPNYSDLLSSDARAAVGFGLRYRLSQKFPIDFSVDLSTNNESEELLYIYAAQRF